MTSPAPHAFDPDAEARLIAAALACPGLRPEMMDELVASAAAEDFADPVHARLWAAAGAIVGRGSLLTPRALADAMDGDEGFARWGGFGLLHDLWDGGSLLGAREAAASVRDRALRRRLAEASRRLGEAARDLTAPAFDHLAAAERSLNALMTQAAPDEACLVDARAAARTAADEIEAEARAGRPRGLKSGLRCIDLRLGGFRPGWLVVLAGRPSMGKTALARSAAMATAMRNPDRLVVFFALEMDRRELSDRTLSELSHLDGERIAYKDMRGDALEAEARARLARLAERAPANLVIDDSPVLSLDYVRRRLHGLRRRGRPGLVVIDYLQIMKRPAAHGRNEASVIGEITQGLKQLARELDCCVLLLSQLNRAVESRDDKRPHLADLRDSGAIEQDANAVLFCYREAYYLERREPSDPLRRRDWLTECAVLRRRMDVIAAKVRGGEAGTDVQDYWAEVDHVTDRAAEDGR